jgi:hypothetical protein
MTSAQLLRTVSDILTSDGRYKDRSTIAMRRARYAVVRGETVRFDLASFATDSAADVSLLAWMRSAQRCS